MHNVRARLLGGTEEWLLSPECKPGMVHLRADMFWQLALSDTQCCSAVIRSYILVESCQVPASLPVQQIAPGNNMPFSQSSCTVQELEGNWLFPARHRVQCEQINRSCFHVNVPGFQIGLLISFVEGHRLRSTSATNL